MAATVVFKASVVRINGRLKSGNASTGSYTIYLSGLQRLFVALDHK